MPVRFKAALAATGLILSLLPAAEYSEASAGQIFPVMAGWIQQQEILKYEPENLYEYIDGAADLYLTYDFQELRVAEYRNEKNASVLIEVYRFNTSDQAFGIYSQERPGPWDYLSIGAQGYQEGPMLNFISGTYYVKISGSDVPDSSLNTITIFALKTAEQIGGHPGLPVELDCFPAAHRRVWSEKFINRNFLGYQFLHSGFISEYDTAGGVYKMFLIRGEDKNDCSRMLQELSKKSHGGENPASEGNFRFNDPHLGALQLTWQDCYIWGIIGLQDSIAQKRQMTALGDNVRRLLKSSTPLLMKGVDLGITFPADFDTIETARVRLGGWVSDSGATVLLDKKPLPVYPSGAFVSLLNLRPGWNEFLLSAAGRDSVITTDTLHLYRIPPLPALPESPTAISPDFFLPGPDLIFYSPDQITVQFMGSPGGTAGFKINDLNDDPLPMIELDGEESYGIKGLYRGVYNIQPGDQCEHKQLIVFLYGKDNKQKKWKTGRFITIYQAGQPYQLETAAESNLVHYQPDGEIFLDLPPGIRLNLIADLGPWMKVRISADHTGYIRAASVQKIGYAGGIPRARCHGFSSRFINDWLVLTFEMNRRVPFQLRQDLVPQSLELTFYDTNMLDEWSMLPENDNLQHPDSALLRTFNWQQIDDGTLQFRFFLNTRQQWGFRGCYEDKYFKLMIRRPPAINRDNPFKNLVIVLDAGHGGEQSGAVGATGYTEKEANLIYADFLARLLQQSGAKVIQTRTADTTISLEDRAELARRENAHILIWLHNNSTGSSNDPLAARGTSTYYTRQQGQTLAQYIYPELVKLGLVPQGRIHRSYYMTRQSDMIVILVEGAFLSHPGDEMFLMKKDNLKNLAAAVFQGLKRFLGTLAE